VQVPTPSLSFGPLGFESGSRGVDPSTEFSPTYPTLYIYHHSYALEDADATYQPSPELGRLGVAATAAFAWKALRNVDGYFRAHFEETAGTESYHILPLHALLF
jgi:hypothetical protein